MARIRSSANDIMQIEREMRGLKSQNLAVDPSQSVQTYQYRAHWEITYDPDAGKYDKRTEVELYEPGAMLGGKFDCYTSAWLENVKVPDTDYLYVEDWWVTIRRDSFVSFTKSDWEICIPDIKGTYSGDVVVCSYKPGALQILF